MRSSNAYIDACVLRGGAVWSHFERGHVVLPSADKWLRNVSGIEGGSVERFFIYQTGFTGRHLRFGDG